MSILFKHRRKNTLNRLYFKILCLTIGLVVFIGPFSEVFILIDERFLIRPRINHELSERVRLQKKLTSIYGDFTQWNQTLCSDRSDNRGSHQKIICISIYGQKSEFTDNQMYSWEKTIISLVKLLVDEINTLLPGWILRIYTDFTGSTEYQRELLFNFSSVDVCDINNLPFFGSSLRTFLPGKMWRFLPVFDRHVDYLLSRDLDSPITRRETETIDLWLSDEQKDKFFYIARDNLQHSVPILGGLWGAAMKRARQNLIYIFQPMLLPSIARRYRGAGDQGFLSDYIFNNVKSGALIFDSYYCLIFGGRPFLSRRSSYNCYLGCVRPCCTNVTMDDSNVKKKPCSKRCRPKKHPDWIYC